MQGRFEDAARVVHADDAVARRVHDQQRASQRTDALFLRLAVDVVDEAAPDGEWPPAEVHLRLAVGLDDL